MEDDVHIIDRLGESFSSIMRFSDSVPSNSEFYNKNKPRVENFWLSFDQDIIKQHIQDEICNIEGKTESDIQKSMMQFLIRFAKKASKLNFQVQFDVVDTHTVPIFRTYADLEASRKPDGCIFLKGAPMTCTFYVISFFDFLKKVNASSSFTPSDFGQIMAYATSLLTIEQRHRKEIVFFIANPVNIQFLKATRIIDIDGSWSIQFCQTRIESIHKPTKNTPIPMGLYQLFMFFASSMGYEKIQNPFTSFIIDRFLGSGASSMVFSIQESKDNNKNRVIKILNDEEEAIREAAVLNLIKNVPHVPQIVDRKDKGLCIFFPLAKHIKRGSFTCKHALQCLETLEKVHRERKLVHRDFRPTNLMMVPNDDILINDWGFAIEAGKEEIYNGTLLHASDRILEIIASGKKSEFAVYPGDDLESFVRTVFVLLYPRFAIAPVRPTTNAAKNLIKLWETLLPQDWKDLKESARREDYDDMRTRLKRMIP